MAAGNLPSLAPADTRIAVELLYLYLNQQRQSDFVILNSGAGLVLKDTQATPHYWRVQVNTSGVLTTTDLGTAPP